MYDFDKANELMLHFENTIEAHDSDAAFLLITSELATCEDIYLNECILPLNFLRHKNTFDWIEDNAGRIINVSSNWGHLAASAYFSWDRAEKWLNSGRPLSLIALDALLFCTTRGERLNQSAWMQENKPTLTYNPGPTIAAQRLQEYLKIDKVPRTKAAVEKIIGNIFDV